jgi:pilus assembly protein CpaE
MTQTLSIHPLTEVALVTRNPHLGRAIAETLRQGGAHLRLMADGLSDTRAALPDLAILDVDLDDPAELAELERVLTTFGSRVAFVVTSETPTVDGMRTLLRHGIVDLLPQPLVAEDVLRAVRLALEGAGRRVGRVRESSDPSPKGHVVCVLGGGGGAGATTIATQAACAMAKGALGTGRVCLLDFDIQFGSAAFHLGLPQRTNLLDLVAAGERLDGAMLKTTMARHQAGVEVLAAPPGIHPLDTLTPELAVALLNEARNAYALSIVDLPPSWTAGTRAALAEADRILLVLQSTMPSLRHARRQLETLREEGLDHVPVMVVANRTQQGLFANGPRPKDMEAAIGRRIDHYIPTDERFLEAVNLGKTLSDLGATRTVKRLAALLDGLAQPAAASL